MGLRERPQDYGHALQRGTSGNANDRHADGHTREIDGARRGRTMQNQGPKKTGNPNFEGVDTVPAPVYPAP